MAERLSTDRNQLAESQPASPSPGQASVYTSHLAAATLPVLPQPLLQGENI